MTYKNQQPAGSTPQVLRFRDSARKDRPSCLMRALLCQYTAPAKPAILMNSRRQQSCDLLTGLDDDCRIEWSKPCGQLKHLQSQLDQRRPLASRIR
jgi:hypothetical protein